MIRRRPLQVARYRRERTPMRCARIAHTTPIRRSLALAEIMLR
jgi:hypothetical protein